MKDLLITTIAAVVLVGCGESQYSVPAPEMLTGSSTTETKQRPPTVKAPDISIGDAALFGNIEAIKQHIAAGADVNEKDEKGATPLHGAAFTGRMEVVELLIANGADVNAKAEDGSTPLHHAALWGHKKIAELLIDKGANVNAKEKEGITPLDVAEKVEDYHSPEQITSKKETADLLRKHGGKTKKELEAAGN